MDVVETSRQGLEACCAGTGPFLVHAFLARDLATRLNLRIQERRGVRPRAAPMRNAWGAVANLWDPRGAICPLDQLNKTDSDSGTAR